ncbi:hypothetical protein H072_3308 [Dactylellina haptotyla CBS 200.50]|uniref:Zn(2)-C6 fungal-type domain-containing protein n=1 Tax=Dactylellina haptotyla (strain CBS 200.50) TaxID=1284197 RepID=S8C4N3_DACHA|nr:hypothetical protein H072_3308 [Dactylellina haptotyla CBS 200.50]
MEKGRKGRRHSVPHIHMREDGDGSSSGSSRSKLAIIAPRNEKDKGPAILRSPKDGVFKDRLPPRSRTGCWTCRTRKVKCSEEHPVCSQCARLQHQCDYHPRLSFRDDTRRIVERMPEVLVMGSIPWDPKARIRRNSVIEKEPTISPEALALPPFAELITDEDRELKATTRTPATLVVVLTPDSFVNSDVEDNIKIEPDDLASPLREKVKVEDDFSLERSLSWKRGQQNQAISSSPAMAADPDIVILARFEEPIIKPPSLTPTTTTSSTGRRLSVASIRSAGQSSIATSKSSPQLDVSKVLPTAVLKEEPPQVHLPFSIPDYSLGLNPTDSLYLDYYRNYVSQHVFHVRGVGSIWNSSILGEDFFNVEATKFPPLFHAMMAVSAFSFEHKSPNGNNFVQSLQHYQAVLPALQSSLSSPVDLTSDGILYTHFFLLLYEIAAAEAGRPNLWQQHLSQLRSFLFERVLLSTSGATPFIIWYLVAIDVIASLAGVEDGDLTESFLRNNLITDFKKTFAQTAITDSFSIFSSPAHQALENEAFLQALSLNQELILLGSTIAKTRIALKTATPLAEFTSDDSLSNSEIQASVRESQVHQILEELQRVWIFHQNGMANLAAQTDAGMSTRLTVLQSQARLFYHALNLYARTSMWPQQTRETADVETNSTEISLSIQAIMSECSQVLSNPTVFFSTGFLVFPLFMAGISAMDARDRAWVLDTLTRAGAHTVGRNCTVIKLALQNIYQRQQAAAIGAAPATSGAWQDILCGFGVQVALFGF